MRIAIDIRSLQDPYRSGVGVYTEELLRALPPYPNEWLLFANAWKNPPLPPFSAPIVRRYFPNRPLNLWMRAFGWPKLDSLLTGRRNLQVASPSPAKAGGYPTSLDCFFMPNIKFGTVSQGIPLVVTVHDLAFAFAPEFYSRRGQWSHRLIAPKRLLSRADRIIAVSHATKSDLVQLYGLPEEKITVIYPGPGRSEIATPPSGARNGNIKEPIASGAKPSRDILFLATVEPRKNVPGLIRAFGLIADKYPETRLVIAGFPGWGEAQVDQEIRRSVYQSRIVRIPNIDDQTREDLFARAAVFAYPSFYEGFGFPVLEAMACGVPVVAGALGALPEVVGEAGLLADPDDPRSIATALDAILGDETLAANLKERGLARAQDFSWETCASQTLQVLGSFA